MGVVAEGASSFTFPRIVWPQWANWILQSSSWLGSEDCEKAGLVFKVVEDELLLEESEFEFDELEESEFDELEESEFDDDDDESELESVEFEEPEFDDDDDESEELD